MTKIPAKKNGLRHKKSEEFSPVSRSENGQRASRPNRNPFFTDREALLATVFSSFTSAQSPIVALTGLSGIGKTDIALEYSYRFAAYYQIILWLDASSRKVLSTEVHTLADRLSLSHDEPGHFAAFKQWLQGQTRWLLVMDHIDDLSLVDLIVPHEMNSHVLLTTCAQATGTAAHAVPVFQMTTDVSTLFLLRRAGVIPAEASLDEAPAEAVQQATAIGQVLAGHPLALDQAGAFLSERHCSLADYLDYYHQQRATFLKTRGTLLDHRSHPDSVTTALTHTLKEVTRKQARNLDVLRLLAFLHPDTIYETLLLDGAQVLPKPLYSLVTDDLTFGEILANLRNFSLIDREYVTTDTAVLRIHPLVQVVIIDSLTRTQQKLWAKQAVRLLNDVFPEVCFETREACERFVLQAQHCSTLIRDFQLTLKEGGLLLERLGFYFYQGGSFVKAETYLTQALLLQEHSLGRKDLANTAQTLNSLGLLAEQQARYQEAEAFHQRALDIRERVLGPDHPKTIASLHNIADVYLDLARYPEAEQLYLRVLALEAQSGRDHTLEHAKTLNNLGVLSTRQGKVQEAGGLYQRALALTEQEETPSSQDVLTYILDGLGVLAEDRAEYAEAEAFFQRALTICEQLHGDTIETAYCFNKVADVYERQGKYDEAESLYQHALAIAEVELRPDHPDVALFLNNLAFLAMKQEQYQRAEPLYQRALSIYEHALGPNHPYVADVLGNQGQLFHTIGKNEHAENLLRQALTIHEHTLGLTYPATAMSMSKLADLLADLHKYEEAESFFQQALALYLRFFDPKHPDVMHLSERYASLLEHRNKGEEAAKLRQTAQRHEKQEHKDSN